MPKPNFARTTGVVAALIGSTSAFAHHGESAASVHAMEHVLEALPILAIVAVAAFIIVRKIRA